MDKEKTQAAAEEARSFFDKEDKWTGFEDLNQDTMAIPFLRLLQKLSPQLDKKKPEFLPEAEEGFFFNTITKRLYGNKMEIIVGDFRRIYIEWKPDRGGFVGYHSVEEAERIAVDKTFGKWLTKEGNSLQENYVYMVVPVGFEKEGIMVLSLSSTMIKPAREWNRLMTTHIMPNGERALPYYLVWSIESVYTENDKGNWYKPKITFARYVNEQQYLMMKEERRLIPARKIDYKQLEGEHQEAGDTGDTEF